MKYFAKISAACMLGALSITQASAIPADPTLRPFVQPDGSEISLRMAGDEYFHCFLTPDGKPVRKGTDGFFRYLDADGKPTGNVVGAGQPSATDYRELRTKKIAESPRNAYRQRLQDNYNNRISTLASESGFDNSDYHDLRAVPTTGKRKVLVILVEYADQSFSTPNPQQVFHAMLNQEGYYYNGATGSARDYFLRSSFGQYQPDFDVYGPVKLPKNMAYYGANDADDNDMRPGEMVRDACQLLDSQIDFSQYDTSGDGKVDNVYIFYPQLGEATGGPEDSIWPHSWDLDEIGINLQLDGVKISHYATSDELNNRGQIVGIGTFCHEFTHVLGLPDIYDTYYGGAMHPGDFTIEASGSYNNQGRTPPVFSAYERYALEWIKPSELPADATVEMLPSVDYPVMYKIPTNIAWDYFLVENRQPLAWDAYLPGNGMLVWHIDYDQNYWDYNIVNTEPDRQRIDIIEADPIASHSSYARFTYPGAAEVFSLTSDKSSAPTLRNFHGYNTHTALTDIHVKPDGVLSFRAKGQGKGSFERPEAPKVSVVSVANKSFTINWTPVDGMEYYATVMTPDTYRGNNLEACAPSDYVGVKMGTSGKYTFEYLEAGIPYLLWVRAVDNKGGISEPTTVMVPLLPEKFDEDWRGLINEAVVDNESAVLSWPASATVELTVGEHTSDQVAEIQINDFSNLKLTGWRVSGVSNNEDKFGKASPSISLNNTGASITSPVFDTPVLKLSFWAARAGDALAMLDVIGFDEKRLPVSFTTLDSFTTEGSTIELTMPDNVRCVKLNYRHTGMSLLIDDVTLSLGNRIYTPIEGYDALNVSGGEISIPGLDKEKEYCAFVRPAGSSKRSNVVKFKGGGSSAINDIAAGAADRLVCHVAEGVLNVEGDTAYAVFTPDGKCLTSEHYGSFRLPAPGIYIVRSGRATAKVVY